MPGIAVAEEVSPWDYSTLSGNWDGKRSSWSDSGVNIEFTHRSDVISSVSGGLQQGTFWLGYTDVRVSADLGKLYGWDGLTAYTQLLSTLGDKPNANQVGSFMGVDNVETASNTVQFYHAWLQQNLFEDTWSILMGLYPVDSEFYVTDSSGLFIHPSLGMAAEVGQTGVNGPPVYPMGALGTRIKYSSPDRTTYAQLALLDGVPGDPNNPNGTHILLNQADGTFAIAEVGYMPLEAGHTFEPIAPAGTIRMAPAIKLHEKLEGVNKTAFGVWRYTARFNDLVDVDAQGNPIQRASIGWYALAERTLFAEEEDASQGLAGFLRFGTASADIHQSDWSASTGLRYIGLVPGRNLDAAGFAVTSSHASNKYRSLHLSAADEAMIEVTYRIQLALWLAVQPMVQRIIHPSMDSTIPDASVLGVRIEVFL
jgi:porin